MFFGSLLTTVCALQSFSVNGTKAEFSHTKFFKKILRTQVLFKGLLVHLRFGLLVTSGLGFKARMSHEAIYICEIIQM